MSTVNFYIICFLTGFVCSEAYTSYGTRQEIITAITDNGCSSHQELKPTKTRIENYNLTNL